MKKFISVLLALVMALSLCATAWADDPVLTGFCGADSSSEKAETLTGNTWVYGTKTPFSTDIYKNVSWKLEKNGETDTYTMTISGSGAMADYLAGSVRPWNSYAGKITKLVVESGVTTVGSRTCYNSAALTEVVLPASVTEIGEFSFSGCKALSTIDLSSVTNIRANALRDDAALTNVTLSNALTTIGDQTFRDSGAASAAISIPASVTTIGYGAFANTKFTNTIDLPNVTKVGAYAFNGAKFASVVLTNNALSIIPGKEEGSGKEMTNAVFANTTAVFYTSVPAVMDNLFDNNRMNKTGIIACTNGGSFEAGTEFGGFTLAVPVKDGYTFDGWYSDAAFSDNSKLAADSDGNYIGEPTTTIPGDGRRYYAKWVIKQYTVSFEPDNGSTVPAQSVDYNAKADAPATPPTKTGYTFAGWFAPGADTAFDFVNTPITDDIVLTARWTAKQYHVTFDSDGGSAVPTQTVDHNTKATKPANPTKPGYVFDGWFDAQGNRFDFDTVITGDVTLKAHWTRKTNNNGSAKDPDVKDSTKADAETGGKTVKSGDTFDSGVALYAGMMLVSAAGTVWIARKRGE